MYRTFKIAGFAISSLVLVSAMPAMASEDATCQSASRTEWRSETDVRAAAEALGYNVRRIKIEHGCYEVYARGKGGKKVEVFFDPVSLKIVLVKDKS